MKMSELKKLVESAIHVDELLTNDLSECDNPQVVEMYCRRLAEKSALEAVLEAINGQPQILKIMAGVK